MKKSEKLLMVIAPNNFRDAEFLEPKAVFDDNGIKVDVTSLETGVAVGAEGTEININLPITAIDAGEYRGIVFIGGPGMAEITNDHQLIKLANEFYDKEKIVAAICVAVEILANAKILDGKQATCWPGVKETIKENGGIYYDRPVVVDEKIITANGPDAANEFGEEIVKKIL